MRHRILHISVPFFIGQLRIGIGTFLNPNDSFKRSNEVAVPKLQFFPPDFRSITLK